MKAKTEKTSICLSSAKKRTTCKGNNLQKYLLTEDAAYKFYNVERLWKEE